MSRSLIVAAAQMGPVQPGEERHDVVARLKGLLRCAASRGAQLVVFPEAALTPFFPHWLIEENSELDSYFDEEMPNESTASLFELARELKVAFNLGFAELVRERGVVRRFNSSVLVSPDGEVVGRYRKIHLPGFSDPQSGYPFQNLEKRYFDVGDLGFRTWNLVGTRIGLCICNDRRWPEAFRIMGLQGVELVLLGYNTPYHNPAMPETDRLATFHNHLAMQAGAYSNSAWIAAAAKAGIEAGVHQIGGSCIIAPSGEIVALATTEDDEVVTAEIDLDMASRYKSIFNLRANRHPENYLGIASPKHSSREATHSNEAMT